MQISAYWVVKTSGWKYIWGDYTDDTLTVNLIKSGGGTTSLSLSCCDKKSGGAFFYLKAGDMGTFNAKCTNSYKGPYQCYFGIKNVKIYDKAKYIEKVGISNGIRFFQEKPPSTYC